MYSRKGILIFGLWQFLRLSEPQACGNHEGTPGWRWAWMTSPYSRDTIESSKVSPKHVKRFVTVQRNCYCRKSFKLRNVFCIWGLKIKFNEFSITQKARCLPSKMAFFSKNLSSFLITLIHFCFIIFCQLDTFLETPRINLPDRCQTRSRSDASNWGKKRLKIFTSTFCWATL